jgi:hypothetical protein
MTEERSLRSNWKLLLVPSALIRIKPSATGVVQFNSWVANDEASYGVKCHFPWRLSGIYH